MGHLISTGAKSIFNRRLGQSGRLPSKIATDKPFQAPEDLSATPTGDCLIFKDQPALDRRADEWRGKLDRIPLVDMIHWVLGGGKFNPAAALAEFSKQQSCLLTVMAKTLKATGKTLPAGTIIKSETRGFNDQKKIWKRKFNFTGAPFDRISDFARKKCSPSLGSDDQWDPARKTIRPAGRDLLLMRNKKKSSWPHRRRAFHAIISAWTSTLGKLIPTWRQKNGAAAGDLAMPIAGWGTMRPLLDYSAF